MPRRAPLAALVVGGLAVGACGGGGGDAAPAPAPVAGDAVVALRNVEFNPARLAVHRGATVTWVWREKVAHNIKGTGAAAALVDRATTDTGSYRVTFERLGVYRYRCTIHPGMDGSVTVVA